MSNSDQTIPRHVATTLANAIYEAAQKMGIANADHSDLSVGQCLHLLECMVNAVGGVTAEPVAQVAEDFVFLLRKQPNGERWPVGTQLYAGPVNAEPAQWRNHVQEAIERAKVFDDGSDGADAESARSVVCILTELLVAKDPVSPELNWVQGPYVTDTVGSGWCVRIDGTDVFASPNQYGCKGRISFQVAGGLGNKEEAQAALASWLQKAAPTPAVATSLPNDSDLAMLFGMWGWRTKNGRELKFSHFKEMVQILLGRFSSQSQSGIHALQLSTAFGKHVLGYRPGDANWNSYDQAAYEAAMGCVAGIKPALHAQLPSAGLMLENPDLVGTGGDGYGYNEGENPYNSTLYECMAPFGLSSCNGQELRSVIEYGRLVWKWALQCKEAPSPNAPGSECVQELPQVAVYKVLENVHIELVSQKDGSSLWAVRSLGRCLSTQGEWNEEPSPSNRTEQWLRAHRFPTAQAAFEAVRAQLPD